MVACPDCLRRPHTNVDAEWNIWEDRFATDYTTTIQPVGMKIVISMQNPFGHFDIPLIVDDFLTPAEQIFQGAGTFTGMVGERTVTNVTQTAVWCGNALVLGIESGLSGDTQHAIKQVHDRVVAAEPSTIKQS